MTDEEYQKLWEARGFEKGAMTVEESKAFSLKRIADVMEAPKRKQEAALKQRAADFASWEPKP